MTGRGREVGHKTGEREREGTRQAETNRKRETEIKEIMKSTDEIKGLTRRRRQKIQ